MLNELVCSPKYEIGCSDPNRPADLANDCVLSDRQLKDFLLRFQIWKRAVVSRPDHEVSEPNLGTHLFPQLFLFF